MQEISQYPNYSVTKDGKIFSKYYNKFLKPNINSYGYETVTLRNDKIPKIILVHKIVAETFIPNPKQLKYINHIDGVKTNNKIENLEWCTLSENAQHAVDIGLNIKIKREVYQYDSDNKFLQKFISPQQASIFTGIPVNNIRRVCKGVYRTAGGYYWSYGSNLKLSTTDEDIEHDNWNYLPQFPNYLISKNGEIWSKSHKKLMSLIPKVCGYIKLRLTDKNGKQQNILLHRLVAELYIPNPNNYDCVNHIDGNKSNNNVENLEWCTKKMNSQHAQKNGVMKRKILRKIIVVDNENNTSQLFEDANKAAEFLNVSKASIYNYARNNNICGKYHIKYEDDYMPLGGLRSKIIIQYSNDMEEIKRFNTSKEAAVYFGVSLSAISKYCTGCSKSKSGIILKYAEDSFTVPSRKKKGVIKYDKNMKLIEEYDNVKDAANKLGITESAVIKRCGKNYDSKNVKTYILKYKN